MIALALIAIVCVAMFVVVTFLKKQLKEDLKANQEQFLQLARQQFELEQNKATNQFQLKSQEVESTVKGLKEELEKYQKLLREFEQDRAQKYGNIENQLKNASTATTTLQETTNRLNNILGNVKLRGQWGERMAEDIINHCGLLEGINYQKQTQQTTTTTKPDYTFFLPNNHKINMDVKFPLDNYLKMMNASSVQERESYSKEFLNNVKSRIKEIQNREYINPEEKTLDFVLLFIPNEQVFALIHEQMPELVDESLKQKVVLCSPFTLYAMLCVIRQAFENFRYEKDLKKIIELMEQFLKIYSTFKVRFEDLGKAIEKLETVYGDVRDKSFKNLDAKIRHIEDYKKGKGVSAIESDDILLEPSTELIDDSVVR